MTQNHYDELLALTAEYQRAINGRDKWQAKVDAAKAQIDTLMAPATGAASATDPAPVPAPAPMPTFVDPASAPAPTPVAQ